VRQGVFRHREASNKARIDVKDHHGNRDRLINHSNGVRNIATHDHPRDGQHSFRIDRACIECFRPPTSGTAGIDGQLGYSLSSSTQGGSHAHSDPKLSSPGAQS
jgi:hypothetical protein